MAPKTFNPDSDIPNLTGKVFFVTGGTAGLGSTTVRQLAKHGPAAIYFSGRNATSASELIESIRTDAPSININFLECDLASFASIKSAVEIFRNTEHRLDVLICNAGSEHLLLLGSAIDINRQEVLGDPPGVTENGYEIHFGTNHLGHALLIKLLQPVLDETSKLTGADVRVVILGSEAKALAPRSGIVFDTLKTPQIDLGTIFPGHGWSRYGQSKLANTIYVKALAKHHPNITSVAVHPGVIKTGLTSGLPRNEKVFASLLFLASEVTMDKGSHNQLWAATCDRQSIESGEYYIVDSSVGKQAKSSRTTRLVEKLWDWTQKELQDW